MNNLIIGNHVSFNKNTQLLGSVKEALSYNANTFMFYTGAPQNTARYEIDDSLTEKAKELMKQNNIDINNVVVHAPYIINLANSKNMDFNIRFLKEEISRCDKLGINKMVLHPGSHVGLGIDAGIDNIAFALNETLKMESNVSICLETMAGKGSEIGRTFEEIKKIIDKIENKNRIMVCLDTCHLNDAGYNICEFDKVLKEFDEKIGLNKIGCVHINDSKNPISSHKDRHENIGFGTISFNSLLNVICNDLLKDVPKILETPYIGDNNESKDRLYPPYKFEIEMIRNKKFDINLLENSRNYYK